jgi:hypothetical protein
VRSQPRARHKQYAKYHKSGIFCFMPGRRYEFDPSVQDVVGMLRSGEIVVDRPGSHSHLRGEDLEEALFIVDSRGLDFLVQEVELGRVIGEARCLATAPEDKIVFAHRAGRKGPSRFVLERQAVPTTQATLILKRHEAREGVMVLITAWAGGKSEPEPWDASHDETSLEASILFWASHALTWSPEEEIDFTRPFGTQEELAAYLETIRFLL